MDIKIIANCAPAISIVFGGLMLLKGDSSDWLLVLLGGLLQYLWRRKR